MPGQYWFFSLITYCFPVNFLKSWFYLLQVVCCLVRDILAYPSILYSGSFILGDNSPRIGRTTLLFFCCFLVSLGRTEAACGLELIMSLLWSKTPHDYCSALQSVWWPQALPCPVWEASVIPPGPSKWFFSYHGTFLVRLDCYLKNYYHLYYVLLCFVYKS